jgi:hypothetical protein
MKLAIWGQARGWRVLQIIRPIRGVLWVVAVIVFSFCFLLKKQKQRVEGLTSK